MYPLKLGSRRKVMLTSVFVLMGITTLCRQQRLASETIQAQDELSIRDLLLPQSTVFGAWSLTLQLLGAADIIDKPQGVTKELEKVLTDAASPLGLRLLGVTALEPRHATRGLRALSRSGQLLLGGSVEGGDDADDFESTEGAAPQPTSLYVRAIIATSAVEQGESVAALVRLARTEAVAAWGQRLSAAGLPVAAIEVVSLQPHAPTSIEAKLQAQLMIVQELRSAGSSDGGAAAMLTVADYEVPSAGSYRPSTMGPGGVPSLLAAAALCAGLAGLVLLRARRAAGAAARQDAPGVILSVADGKALGV